ncbi:MAG: VCBS repeat-containing protein [Verrucomicrobiaceae bacterium]|nr:VCBS repeat-containing protein [Verrucomicrobiaceae bacterium]
MKLHHLIVLAGAATAAASAQDIKFHKLTVNQEFWAEGADAADFDQDGKMDVAAGPFVYWGPDFKERTPYSAPKPDRNKPVTDEEYGPNFEAFANGPRKAYDPLGYSDYFLTYAHDFNGDGLSDIVVFSWPGDITAWYQNPGNARKKAAAWKRHIVFDVTDNESPQLGDLNGDGKPELICHTGGRLGFAALDWSNPMGKATYTAISKPDIKKYFRYTHGYGFGDINGDKRGDILDRDGWREQPAGNGEEWAFHAVPFAPEGQRGGSQMQVYDVNGDGRNDVITSWDAHGYGLAWYEQGKDGKFTPHQLMGATEEESPHKVKFSQLHATTMADVNGDGVQDFITGKRYWAHGPNKDAEPGAPAVLYWFEIKRDGKGGADFIPHQIDNDSGVGTQVTSRDINSDGLPDVVVSNKKGLFVFTQERTGK